MSLAAGTRLGPYEVIASIGAGGMGEVYRARDARLQRDVAVKILPASFAQDAERLRRFEQEARLVGALNHPNILAIFDVGSHDGAPYLVSELLEGATLRHHLDGAALPQRRAVEYGIQVARGLAAAHDKAVVHRDLKPDNIFVLNDGRIKILDFGLAKLVREESFAAVAGSQTVDPVPGTDAGQVLGTVGYMSPEQVRGQPADHRTDIFSFGAILYEMLSGKRAFKRDSSVETLTAILKEEPEELLDSAPNLAPGLDRVVRHCLEKNPAQRFRSASDIAFDLEALTDASASGRSGLQTAVAQTRAAAARRRLAGIAGVIALALAMVGLGWWLGRGRSAVPPPEYQQVTFRTGSIGNARFTPDGSIVYSATWENGDHQLYLVRTDEKGSRELGLNGAELLAISSSGELAIRLNTAFMGGYARDGTLARVPMSGGTPREVLEHVQDADFDASGQGMAVVRFVPETRHWRLEYPIGKVLLDGIDWISHPKISPDGKSVAFLDHENTNGDDQGAVALIGPDGHEKKLATGFVSVEGLSWSPSGDELWFSAARNGAAINLQGVTLSGKLRTITNVPGGMWLQDLRNGIALTVTHQIRISIRGTKPGGKEERDLGWLGWGILRDISRDGRKVLFEEEGDGGGPNYTVFLRDTDGSPPVRIGDGIALTISPDGKHVVTKPSKGGPLSVVPTGAGEARQLTHDNVTYDAVRYLPNGKQLLAVGIEAGHGMRDYLIDVSNGNAKPITPEGVVGIALSPDGRNVAVRTAEGKWAIWPLDGAPARPIPELDDKYDIGGWAPDGRSVYVSTTRQERARKVYLTDPATGKMQLWKTFGSGITEGVGNVDAPQFSSDGSAYAYLYSKTLSQAYVVKGAK